MAGHAGVDQLALAIDLRQDARQAAAVDVALGFITSSSRASRAADMPTVSGFMAVSSRLEC